MKKSLLAIGLFAPLWVAACGSDSESRSATGSPNGKNGAAAPAFESGRPSTTPTAAASSCEKMDIVFVVDNSGSMGEEQTNLAQNFALVTSALDSYKTGSGGSLDYRIAITTTARTYTEDIPFPLPIPAPGEQGDDGAFRRGCGLKEPWISRGDPNRAQALSCAANVGDNGPSVEMPLDALRMAVVDRMADGKNAGFLRVDALLAVVIITDEDDCSHLGPKIKDACDPQDLKPLPTFLSALDQVTGGRNRWATAVIAGETACSSAFGSAAEAVRLKEFVAQTGKNAVFSSICQGDLVKPLEAALATFGEACKGFPAVK